MAFAGTEYDPGSVVPQGGDGAVVYSSGALDSFGTDETPVDWPTTGAKIKAIEVELTSTGGFTGDGQVQVAVTKPDALAPVDGATTDTSGSWSGAPGVTANYRTGTADSFNLFRFGESYSTGRVVVAGANTATSQGVVMTSPDGVNWTEVPSWTGAASQVSVAGDAYFVATAAAFSHPNYSYSLDGDNWTSTSSPPDMACVAWTGNYYVNLASNVSYRATAPSGTWAGPTGTGSGSGKVGRRLIYRDGLLVGAIASTATQPSIVVSSNEGASWTAINATPGTSPSSGTPWTLFDMDYGNGKFVAVVARPNSNLDRWVITSPDGVTWTTISTGINDQFPYCIRYGNGKFVALGLPNVGTTRTYTSPDGINWTMHTPTGLPTSSIFSVSQMTFWAGRWIWVNPLMNAIYSSTDGINWSGTSFANRDWRGISAGVATNFTGTTRMRWVADTPYPAEDLRLIVDAQTGALTVDEILLEAECGGGIYVDGAVHF